MFDKIKKIISFYKLISTKRLVFVFIGGILTSISIIANIIYPLLVKNIIENIENYNIINIKLFLFLGLLYISFTLISYVGDLIYNKNKYLAGEEIRKKIFFNSFYFPDKKIKEKSSAYYSDLINNQVNNAFVVLDYVFIQNIFLLIRAIIVMIIVFTWNKNIFLLFLLNTLLVIFYSNCLNKFTKSHFITVQELGRKLNAYIVETFENIQEILAGKAKENRTKSYASLAREITKNAVAAEYKRVNLNNLLLEIPQLISRFIILIYGANLVLNGAMSIGLLWAIWIYLDYAVAPVSVFKTFSRVILEGGVTVENVLNFFNEAIQIKHEYKRFNNIKTNFVYSIENLTVNHGNKNIINDISLKVNKGDIIGLIGISGEGKTTLLNVLLGFERNFSGKVELLGNNIKSLSPEDTFDIISLYSQKNGIFNDTLEQNIVMGRKLEKDKLNELINLLNLYHLKGRVLGENGSFISGGEKQKVHFARFLYSNKPFFIIDEPFTNLDSINENVLISILSNHVKDKTGLVISHKFNIMQLATTYVLLDKGSIIAQNSLKELIKQNDLTKKLINNYIDNIELIKQKYNAGNI